MSYIGDIALGSTIDTKFTTRQISGAPFTLGGSPVISAYVGNSTTQSTSGITLSVDFDGTTGFNNINVVASGGNGYSAGQNYSLVVTTGTVNSVSVVGEVIAEFSIENRSALRPTTAGRTLDIAVTGEAGLDFANVSGATATNSFTNTTIANVTNVTTTLPAAYMALVDIGTAQTATATTLTLRSAAAFANSEINGATLVITGGTGVGQSRVITGYVGATDVATVDAWTTVPSGTITYAIFGTAPASATSLPAVNVTQVGGSTASVSGMAVSVAAIETSVASSGVVVAAASKTGYRLSATGVDDILDEVVEGSTTLRQSMMLGNSALGSKASGLGTTAAIFRDIGDTKNRITATVDASGNRTAITLDLT